MFGRSMCWIQTLLLAIALAIGGPAQAASPKRDDGKPLADEAAARFKEGKFAEAAELFERSFALSPDKLVRLRNAGRAYEEAGKLEAAKVAFERYVTQAPEGPEKQEVRERLQRIEAVLKVKADAEAEARMRAEASQQTAPPADRKPLEGGQVLAAEVEPRSRWVPWTVAATGVALAGAGVVWALDVAEAQDRFDSGNYDYPGGQTKRENDASTLDMNRGLAYTCVGLGAAAALAGTVWALWPEPQAGSVTFLPARRGLALAYRF